jgi:hypothetical protein
VRGDIVRKEQDLELQFSRCSGKVAFRLVDSGFSWRTSGIRQPIIGLDVSNSLRCLPGPRRTVVLVSDAHTTVMSGRAQKTEKPGLGISLFR